jgi:GNAT superfamily N-acetyltransferase
VTLSAADIESLERSVVGGVAPREVVEVGGWLVPLDDGYIGRSKSAVPLRHDLGPEALDAVEDVFAARDLPPAFRVAEADGLAAVRAELARRGYEPREPTIMKLGTAAGMAAASDTPADVFDAPDAPWAAMFAGKGFDPAEAASRMANLKRSPKAAFGAVREAGRTLAVGVASFGQGWVGVHGMRTDPDRRREGLARRVMAGLGRAAQARGHDRVVLQVLEANDGARVLYRSLGFEKAWRYAYWQRTP